MISLESTTLRRVTNGFTFQDSSKCNRQLEKKPDYGHFLGDIFHRKNVSRPANRSGVITTALS